MGEAARLGDPIAHTSALAGFLAGAVIGIALIATVAFATFTCGFGVALLAGLAAGIGASAILGLGESIGRSFSSPSGAINNGSLNVFVNSKQAAFSVGSTVSCSKHNPTPKVAEGSGNVFYNGLRAARKGDAITCGAKIDDGSKNTFVGGGTVRDLEVEDEVPGWLRTTVDWAFALAGLVGGLAGALRSAAKCARPLLPCAAKFVAGFVIGEAVGRTVVGPAIQTVYGGLFGHPVDVTTGRKLLLAGDEVDFVVPSPVPLQCGRFYASNLTRVGSLGRGWVLPWELRLERRDGRVWLIDAQGRETGFPMLQPGEAAFSDTEQKYLTRTRIGRYVVHDLSETYYDFGEMEPGDGDETALLQRIEDQSGHWLEFHRGSGSDDIRLILTSGGQQLRLSYLNIKGRLTDIELVHQRKRHALVRYSYDGDGQLTSVTDARGHVTRRFEYAEGRMTAHSNALGFTCRYEWLDLGGQPRVVRASTSEGEWATFTYDLEGRQTKVVDELGRTASWTYDEHFQVVECIDLDGKRYRTEYTEAGFPKVLHLPAEEGQQRQVKFEYDESGRIVSETDVLGRTTTTRYHRNSLRPEAVQLPDGSGWNAEYDYIGRLLKTSDALGREECFEYPEGSASPWPVARVDAKGGRKVMQWSRTGQLIAYTDCSKKSSRFEYDAFGGLVLSANALEQTTRIERLPTGQVSVVELPDGGQERFEYDAQGLLVAHHDRAGHTRHWQRNARGQVVQATDAAGRKLDYRYDPQGRLVELASATGAYVFEYDAGDRLVLERRPDGVQRRLRYGAFGQAVALQEVGSGAGQPAERSTSFERDAASRLLAHQNDSATTTYTWDDGDRLLKVDKRPTQTGQALGVNPSTVSFKYDKAGRLMSEHGRDGILGYELDELDNVLALNLPNEQRIAWLSYGSGHVHQVRCGDQVIADIERDDLHREVLRTQGRLTLGLGYDTLGRQMWQSSGMDSKVLAPMQGKLWRTYRYSAEGELAEQVDNMRGALQYQYDPAGQLLRRSRPDGRSDLEQFAWDAAGNLLDEVQRKSAGRVQGNRLAMWQDIRFEYDVWGNLKTKRSGSRQTQHFVFDAENRLLAVKTVAPGGTVETCFEYDALGRRVGRTERQMEADGVVGGLSKRSFVWQGLRMVQELRDSGLSNYVYSPDSPYTPMARVDTFIGAAAAGAAIAKAQQSSRVYHFHTDLVGAPLEMTDDDGDLAWSGMYTAWGRLKDEANRSIEVPIEQPLRYPGQYADESTGLHYNTLRYYDPDVGRFISQDPVGLLGGENLYAYAPNPTAWADPEGLSPSQILAAAMARAGSPVPSGYAAHHLIPTNVAGRSNLIQEAMRRGIYNPNGASNGTALPMSAAESLASGKPLHSGGHLSSYYDVARNRLLAAEQKLGNLAAATDEQLLRKIGAVERSMRMSLGADQVRLQRTDPRAPGTRSSC